MITSFSDSLFNAIPRELPTLDPGFRPLSLGLRAYRDALAAWPTPERVCIALEQTPQRITRKDLAIFPAAAGREADNFRFVAWMVNFLLWARGGWRVTISGPEALCRALVAEYAPGGPRAFDAGLMTQAFGRPFEIQVVPEAQVPEPRTHPSALGGHLEGCRIGFDLGASDYKVAAVIDGEAVWSEELPWDPKVQPDPAYHYERIQAGLKLAASHLPRVDAIGGSSAGILLDNQVMVASLFRAVPAEAFAAQVKPLFNRLQAEWGVPVEVINDGDVTALAGALSLEASGMLGIAMGSSQAAGFLDRAGHITGWLNELAFAPIDASPEAGTDDWSGNPGIGAAYFSQQAVNKLGPPAGFTFEADMGLPERLKVVQACMEAGDARAHAIFEAIGIYLGYAIPWYAEFYDLEQAMILGRVTSGKGGELILSKAKQILASEFPEVAAKVAIFLPDERARRVGQAVAAASLPSTNGKGGGQ
jgi:predicted NBD/HSP70 family sugar kinase